MAGNNAKLYAYRVKELPWAKGSINYFFTKKGKAWLRSIDNGTMVGKNYRHKNNLAHQQTFASGTVHHNIIGL